MFDSLENQAHPCTTPGCTRIAGFDDEPWCFECSPDSRAPGVPGYSYAARHAAPAPAGHNINKCTCH